MAKAVIVFLMVSGLLSGVKAQAEVGKHSCLNPQVKSKDDSKILATDFISVGDFSVKQRELLDSLMGHSVSQNEFTQWTKDHNDDAATFLAVTHAMSLTDIEIEGGGKTSALEMVSDISEIRGVRLIAHLNLEKFDAWRKNADYFLHKITGDLEEGLINFADHDQKGGGLHCGFDIQGFTAFRKTPYIHWNVNLTSGLSDLHLDGLEPWFGGIIPNPNHLTYANSDIRAWYAKYLKKYGSPGFTVTK